MATHRAHPLGRSFALAAALVLALAGLVACGDDDEDSGATTTTAADAGAGAADDDYGSPGDDGSTDGAEETSVVAQGFAFTAPASVAAGATVTFDNQDSATHTLTADDGGFDAGRVSGGSQADFTAPAEPGEYAFHCEIHTSMTGTLVVE